jgi:hypothetical protein
VRVGPKAHSCVSLCCRLWPQVWRLLSLPDGTLVSGDSDGAVQFWEPRFGTLLARFAQHKADVLALAADEDGGSVWAAGVDPQVGKPWAARHLAGRKEAAAKEVSEGQLATYDGPE